MDGWMHEWKIELMAMVMAIAMATSLPGLQKVQNFLVAGFCSQIFP